MHRQSVTLRFAFGFFGEESQRHWKFSGVGCVGLAVRLEYSHVCSCTMTVYHGRRCDLSDESTEFLEPRRRYSMEFKRPALLVQFQSNSSKGSEGSKGSKCSNRLETKAQRRRLMKLIFNKFSLTNKLVIDSGTSCSPQRWHTHAVLLIAIWVQWPRIY